MAQPAGVRTASMSQAQLGDGAQRAVVEKGWLSRLASRYSLRRKIGPASARISKLMTLGIHVHHSRVSCIHARAEEQKKIGADLDGGLPLLHPVGAGSIGFSAVIPPV